MNCLSITYWPLGRLIGSFCDIFLIYVGVSGSGTPLIHCAPRFPAVRRNRCPKQMDIFPAMPWPCHAMAMPWPCHGHAMPWPCHGHGMAMARLCTGEPSRDLCPGKGDMHHSAKVAFRVHETLVWNNPPDPPDPANPLQSTQNGVENHRPDPPFHTRRGQDDGS